MEGNARKLAWSINEFCKAAGIGRTKVYELIKSGKLRTITVGRRRLIPSDAVDELFANNLAFANDDDASISALSRARLGA